MDLLRSTALTPAGARLWSALSSALVIASCADTQERTTDQGHEELSDFEEVAGDKADGIDSEFDRNRILEDSLWSQSMGLSAEDVQTFLEHTPYDRPCFLADEQIDGRSFAQVLVEVAQAHELNPVLLLVRLQVERSMISQATRPSKQEAIDFAFGCGCFDDAPCSESFRGLDKQLDCAAQTLQHHFDAADDPSSTWAVGQATTSSDGLTVTPANAATASLYAYTPWVLEGSGGNWLVWNVTRRFVVDLAARGLTDDAADDGNSEGVSYEREVQHMWSLGCMGQACHSSGNSEDLVDLSGGSQARLVGTPSSRFSGRFLVVPGDPDSSLLYLKLAGEQGSSGERMPKDGPMLNDARLAIIRTWIEQGAKP